MGTFIFLGLVIGACLGRNFQSTTDPVTGQKKVPKGKDANSADEAKKQQLNEAGQNAAGGAKSKGGGGAGNKALIGANTGQSAGISMEPEVNESMAAAGEAAQDGAATAGEAVQDGAADAAASTGRAATGSVARAKSLAAAIEKPKSSLRLSICDGLTEKFKIAAAYCQVTNLFYETLTIPWPEEIRDLYEAMGTINFDMFQIFNVGCVVGTFYEQFMAVMVRLYDLPRWHERPIALTSHLVAARRTRR
jgi:hypothetical protein